MTAPRLFESARADGLGLHFATPVLRYTVPNAANALADVRRVILARAASTPGAPVSAGGGWQSAPDLVDWPEPELAPLRQWIVGALRVMMAAAADGDLSRVDAKFTVAAWANVNRAGDFNYTHIHPNNHWSGVVYIDAGGATGAHDGAIEFLDPRPAASAMPVPAFPFGHKLTIVPEPGLLLLFPAWLAHWVQPYRGDGTRISIAFNVWFSSFEVRAAEPAS